MILEANLTQANFFILTIKEFLMAPSSLHIKQATLKLRQQLKTNPALGSLLQILKGTNEKPVLQLTIVLLSKIIRTESQKLSVTDRNRVQEILLIRLGELHDTQLQRGISGLINRLLQVTPFTDWVSLQQFIKNGLDNHQQKNLVLIQEIVQHFQMPEQLMHFVLNLINQTETSERALDCLEAVVEAHPTVLNKQLVEKTASEFDPNYHTDNENVKLLEILTLVAKKQKKLDTKVMSWVCRTIVSNPGLSARVRSCGIDFIFVASKKEEKLLSKRNFIKEIVQAACAACSQTAGPPSKDSQILKDVALWLIEARITKVHNKNAFDVLFQTVSMLINSNTNEEMLTGFTVMTGISQSCTEKLRLKLGNPIMSDFIPRGLDNPDPNVRTAALKSLCYFCEFLYPDILDYHSLIINALMKQINGLGETVAVSALTALDMIMDKLEPEQIIGYLPCTVNVLVEIIANPTSTVLMKEQSLNVLGTLVENSQLKFMPYLQTVMAVSLPIFQSQYNTLDKLIHANNISLQGKMIREFCNEKSPIRTQYFQTYVLPHLENVYKLLNNSSDERQIIEASFVYFYKIADAIGDEFSVIFPRIIDRVMEVCEAEIDFQNQGPEPDEILSLDSSSDVSQEEGVEKLKLSVSQVDMKAAALHTLGNMANACPLMFSPYLERAESIFTDLSNFCLHNIREQVIQCRMKITLGMVKSHFGGKIPPYKEGLPCMQRYPLPVEQYLHDKLYQILVDTMLNEISVEVKVSVCGVLETLSKQLGPIFIENNLSNLCGHLREILQLEQNIKNEEQQDPEQLPDDEEHEQHLVDAVGDLIQRLSKVFRQSFQDEWDQLMPTLMGFLKCDMEKIQECVGIVGCISKCLKHLPGKIAACYNELLTRLGELQKLGHERLNRNMAYCVGIMFQMSAAVMQQHLTSACQLLWTIYHQSFAPATIQNAIAALCRIAYSLNPPINYQEFMTEIIRRMPFTGDLSEVRTVYKMLMFMAKHRPYQLQSYWILISQWLNLHLSEPTVYGIKQEFEEELCKFRSFVIQKSTQHY